MPAQIVVVIVEDEVIIRTLVADLLRDEGFDVREAGHADDALAILQDHAPGIHALFTDIQMPGAMDGLALAHHTKRHWACIALLIVSGRGQPHQTAMPAGSRFLAKPYDHRHVIRHIQEMIAA